MFTRPEIAAALKEFVLVELYTDAPDGASEENQKPRESRFQTVAIPCGCRRRWPPGSASVSQPDAELHHAVTAAAQDAASMFTTRRGTRRRWGRRLN